MPRERREKMYPQDLITNLPTETISRLSGNCQYLLHIFHHLCYCTSKKSHSGAWYCYPSEEWLARRTGRSRVQISRSVQRLSKMGLIDLTHRRKVRGVFQTNLYRLGRNLLAMLNKAKSLINRSSHRVTFELHKVPNTILVKNQQGLKHHLIDRARGPTWEEIVNRLEKKLFHDIK
jgi:DNA-binding MarR family transcriptional regulator